MKLSVIIPNYNHGLCLERAISTCCEAGKEIEVVVIDDGSSDDSHEIITKLQKRFPQLVYIRFEQNRGIAAALNAGLEAASGEYFHPHGADDHFLPGMLKKLLGYFERYPHHDYFFSNYQLGEKEKIALPGLNFSSVNPNVLRALFSRSDFFIYGHAWFARRSAFRSFLPYKQELGSVMDWLPNHCAVLQDGVGYIPDLLKWVAPESPRSFSITPRARRKMQWQQLLCELEREPKQYEKLVKSGILRMLGVRCIFMELAMKRRYWRYLFPILYKMVMQRFASSAKKSLLCERLA